MEPDQTSIRMGRSFAELAVQHLTREDIVKLLLRIGLATDILKGATTSTSSEAAANAYDVLTGEYDTDLAL